MSLSKQYLIPAGILATTVLTLAASLTVTGSAASSGLFDPGVVIRVGLPLLSGLNTLTTSVLIGALVLATWALNSRSVEYARSMNAASVAAALTTLVSAATLILTCANVTRQSNLLDERFSSILLQYVTEIELGRSQLAHLLLAAVTTIAAVAIRDQRAVLGVTIGAFCTIIPLALQGHAAGSAAHDIAVNALGLHLATTAVWLGALLVLSILHGSGERNLATLVTRYSTLALPASLLVGISGVVSAQLRVGSLDNLNNTYGQLLIAKTLCFVVLAAAGAWHRTRTLRRVTAAGAAPGRWFWRIVLGELLVMGATVALAANLAITKPPIAEIPGRDQANPTPAQILTGEPLPTELLPVRYLTEWRFDLVWASVVIAGIVYYLLGVRRLRRRGDSWPIARTLLWCCGMLLLGYATNGAFNVYERYLFSVHMLAHMLLTMAIPMLLVFGAPVTLASRAIEKRKDGSRGSREWILWAVHTPYASALTQPYLAAALFAGSLWVFYFTPLARWATTEHLGHQWMIIHFLITGYLFSLTLVGIDPVRRRLPYPFRLLLLMATMAFHAFFGLAILSGSGLMLADWYGAMGRTWGAPPLEDQQNGGGIAWGIGELPTLILAITVAVQWSRHDKKEAKRQDRNADRNDDAELRAYNAMLRRRAERQPAP